MAIGKNPKKAEKADTKKSNKKDNRPKGKVPQDKKKQISIVRLMETNVDGNKPLYLAMNKIKGVAPMFGNAVSVAFGDVTKKVADLTDAEINKIEDIISNPAKYNIPAWLYNRRKDPENGSDMHLAASNLVFAKTMDINKMKKIRSYRGIRHMFGLPVRGQRTRSSFRKGTSVGVKRKKGAK